MLVQENEVEESSRENFSTKIKNTINRKTSYLVFSIIYFIISLIQIYVIVYIPLFHFDILNVNRYNLSLIQLFSYLVLFTFPAFGFFYDKYSKHKTKIISFFSFLLSFSFLIFIFNSQVLANYTIFLVLFLFSQAIIRTGMSKLLLESPDERSERNIIILINVCSALGVLLPSFLFKFFVKLITDINSWNRFFIIGWIISSPLLFLFLFKGKYSQKKLKSNTSQTKSIDKKLINNFSLISMSFIFIAYFLLWSDKLYAYPFSSYINTQFGEDGFSLYSDFYIIFIILNITGFYLAKVILDKISVKESIDSLKNKKILQIIVYLTLVYVCSLLCLLSSQIFVLLISNSIINFLGGLFVVLYTNLFIRISKNGKNENLRYWIMALSSNLASIVFLPLGTYLSIFVNIGTLILIVIILTLISMNFIFFTILNSRKNLLIKK